MTGTWRNAKTEFPPDGKPVLCLSELKSGERRYRIGSHWCSTANKAGSWYIGGMDRSVIAWMALPEIPQGEIMSRFTVQDLEGEFKDCVNELCLKCGEYKHEHEGACNGCRWLNPRRGW